MSLNKVTIIVRSAILKSSANKKGATPKLIRNQFLIESIVICQLGGIFGIILGVISGNVVALFTDGFFVIPWLWIISSIFLCFCVGISTGIFPAIQASKLNPIDALRYE